MKRFFLALEAAIVGLSFGLLRTARCDERETLSRRPTKTISQPAQIAADSDSDVGREPEVPRRPARVRPHPVPDSGDVDYDAEWQPSSPRLSARVGSNPVAVSDEVDSDIDLDDADQILMQLLIVELRGNVQRALKEADFHASPSGHRYTSATARSSGQGSEWLVKQIETMKGHAEVDVLSRPQIRTLSGQSAQIQVCTAVPQIPYMVRNGKKTFELREFVAEPVLGLTISMTAQAVGEDPKQIEISPVKISTTTFDGREPIPGVDLDVGKPIISTRRLETSITLTDGGETSGIVLPGPTGRQAVMFLTVRRFTKKAREMLPQPAVEAKPAPVANPKPNSAFPG
jgi:hypothetical protein